MLAAPAAAETPGDADCLAPQTVDPCARPPEPGVFVMKLDTELEHSCSRSSQTVASEGELRLTLRSDGSATLEGAGEHLISSGPSFGAYRRGERGFSRRTEAWSKTLSGRWRLEPRDGRTARVELGPAAGEGAPRRDQLLTLTCQRAMIDAHDPPKAGDVGFLSPPEGAKPRPTEVLQCGLSGWQPDPLSKATVEGKLLFGAKQAIVVTRWKMGWSVDSTVVRRAR